MVRIMIISQHLRHRCCHTSRNAMLCYHIFTIAHLHCRAKLIIWSILIPQKAAFITIIRGIFEQRLHHHVAFACASACRIDSTLFYGIVYLARVFSEPCLHVGRRIGIRKLTAVGIAQDWRNSVVGTYKYVATIILTIEDIKSARAIIPSCALCGVGERQFHALGITSAHTFRGSGISEKGLRNIRSFLLRHLLCAQHAHAQHRHAQ